MLHKDWLNKIKNKLYDSVKYAMKNDILKK